jgi:hypothetical protein
MNKAIDTMEQLSLAAPVWLTLRFVITIDRKPYGNFHSAVHPVKHDTLIVFEALLIHRGKKLGVIERFAKTVIYIRFQFFDFYIAVDTRNPKIRTKAILPRASWTS